MPLTASLQMSPGSVASGQPAMANLILANAGASALVVQSIDCFATPHNGTAHTVPVLVGQPNIGPGFSRTVAANSAITVSFPVVGYSAARDGGEIANPPLEFYDIHALVQANDATNVEAIAALTVIPPTGPAVNTVPGFLDFSQAGNSPLAL